MKFFLLSSLCFLVTNSSFAGPCEKNASQTGGSSVRKVRAAKDPAKESTLSRTSRRNAGLVSPSYPEANANIDSFRAAGESDVDRVFADEH